MPEIIMAVGILKKIIICVKNMLIGWWMKFNTWGMGIGWKIEAWKIIFVEKLKSILFHAVQTLQIIIYVAPSFSVLFCVVFEPLPPLDR